MQKKRYYKGREPPREDVIEYWNNILKHKPKVEKVLDVGCGTGFFGKHKPKGEIQVYGCDIDEHALRIAQKHEITRKCDLESYALPYENKYFDAVIAKDILEHLLKPWLLVKEMKRVLKNGGIALATVPDYRSKTLWDDYTHVKGYTRQSLRLLFEDQGFKTLEIRPYGGIPGFGKLKLKKEVPLLLTKPLFKRFLSGWVYVGKK